MTDLLAVARGDRVHVEDDDVVRAASSEGLLGLLARAATNPVRELQIQAITIEAYSAFMAGELARIAGVFTERNVPLIAFKGPVLSQQLYGHAGLRSFSDLDVLVAPASADAGEELLRELGYREHEPLTAPARRTNRRFSGETLYVHYEQRVLIDFHTLFSNEQFPLRLSFDDVWRRRTEVVIDGMRIPSLGDADLVVVTCSHAAKHLWHKLEFLAQIAALAKKQPDWNEVDRIAVDARAARQVGLSFLLARDLLGIDTPPLPRCLAAASPHLERVKRIIGARHDATGRDLFLLLDRRRDALRALALAIFVPTHTDWRGSKLPAQMQWVVRPFRLLCRTGALACRSLLRGRTGSRTGGTGEGACPTPRRPGAPDSRGARAGTSRDY